MSDLTNMTDLMQEVLDLQKKNKALDSRLKQTRKEIARRKRAYAKRVQTYQVKKLIARLERKGA